MVASGELAGPGIALTALGSSLGVLSGVRENASEIYENVSSIFADNLRKSGKMEKFIDEASKQLGKKVDFDQAMQALSLGQIKPSVDIDKQLVNSTFGANNLFKHDMFAVTADNLFETAINFVPYGALGKAALLKPLVGAEWSA
jgi:hypothetical protein